MSTFPLEPQIRKRRDGVGGKQAARDWLKTVGCSVKMCEKGWGKRNEETYLWLWPETAVSLQCSEDESSLISSSSCDSVYDARLLSSEGHGPTSSLNRERKSIRLSDQSLQGKKEVYCFAKQGDRVKSLLLLLFHVELNRIRKCFFGSYSFCGMKPWQL